MEEEFENGEEIMEKIEAYRGAMIEVIPEDRKRDMDKFLCDFVYFVDRLTKAGISDHETITTLYSIYRKDHRMPNGREENQKRSVKPPTEKQIKYAKHLYEKHKPDVDMNEILKDAKKTSEFIKKYANKEG